MAARTSEFLSTDELKAIAIGGTRKIGQLLVTRDGYDAFSVTRNGARIITGFPAAAANRILKLPAGPADERSANKTDLKAESQRIVESLLAENGETLHLSKLLGFKVGETRKIGRLDITRKADIPNTPYKDRFSASYSGTVIIPDFSFENASTVLVNQEEQPLFNNWIQPPEDTSGTADGWERDDGAEFETWLKEQDGKLLVVGFDAGGYDISVYTAIHRDRQSYEGGADPESKKAVTADSSEGSAYRFVNAVHRLLEDDEPQKAWDSITKRKR